MVRLLFVLISIPILLYGQTDHEYHFGYLKPVYVKIKSYSKNPSYDKASKIAHSYLALHKAKESTEWFEKAMTFKELTQDDNFLYISQLIKSEKYQLALRQINVYFKRFGENDVLKNYVRSIKNQHLLITERPHYSIKKLDFCKPIIPEFASTQYKEGIAYIQPYHHYLGLHSEGHNPEHLGFYDLVYYSFKDSKKKFFPNRINSKFHEGPSCFARNDSVIYFTRNNYLEHHFNTSRNDHVELKIFRSEFRDNKWQKETPLGIDFKNHSCTDPWVSNDESLLFYSSNSKNGVGGYDIYYSKADSTGIFNKSKLLTKKYASSEHEAFPWFDERNRLLYFSSDGLGGLGGLDVYVAVLDEDFNVHRIHNLGAPINSSSDDFGFSIDTNGHGYFTSDRDGDEDIYEVQKTKFKTFVKGKIAHSGTLEPVPFTRIIVKRNGIDFEYLLTDKEGNYSFYGDDADTYTVDVMHEGFQTRGDTVRLKRNYNYHDNLTYLYTTPTHMIAKVIPENSRIDFSRLTVLLKSSNSYKYDTLHCNKLGEIRYSIKPETFYELLVFDKFKYHTIKEFTSRRKGSTSYLTIRLNEIDINKPMTVRNLILDNNIDKLRFNPALEPWVDYLRENSDYLIEVGVHTSTYGNRSENFQKSQIWAEKIQNYFWKKGIGRYRIKIVGYGEEVPKNNCIDGVKCTRQEQDANERVEIRIIGFEN